MRSRLSHNHAGLQTKYWREWTNLAVTSFVNKSAAVPHILPKVGAVVTDTPIVQLAKSLEVRVSNVRATHILCSGEHSIWTEKPLLRVSLQLYCAEKMQWEEIAEEHEWHLCGIAGVTQQHDILKATPQVKVSTYLHVEPSLLVGRLHELPHGCGLRLWMLP